MVKKKGCLTGDFLGTVGCDQSDPTEGEATARLTARPPNAEDPDPSKNREQTRTPDLTMTSSKHAVVRLVALSSSAAPEPVAYRQVVSDATIDGDYLCALHPRTMKRLSISDGDIVLLKSKRRRETRCVAVADEECPERKLKINEAIGSDLRVRQEDVVFAYVCPDAKHVGGRGSLRPVDELLEQRMSNCSLFVS